MSGSIVNVAYTNSAGGLFALRRDESNSRGTVGLGAETTNRAACFLAPAIPFTGTLPPAGFRPRVANCQLQSNPLIRRRFPIGNTAAFAIAQQPNATILASLTTNDTPVLWNVTSVTGERSARNVSFASSDTGQTDGTAGGGVAGGVT